jgi:hypothetical protein
MPADYQLLMQHCWATEASARPKISRVLEALQYMVRQRQQQQQGADGTSSELGPLPVLLSMPLPRKQQPWQHQMQRAAVLKVSAVVRSHAVVLATAAVQIVLRAQREV